MIAGQECKEWWICLYKMWLLYKSNVGITARKAFVFAEGKFFGTR